MYSSNLVCNIINYIDSNINKEITIDELSSIFHYDKTYLMKKFKKEIGITINEYINTFRIYNSLSFYRYDNYILNIAFNNGFQSLEYYSEIFKKYMGVSPIIYQNYTSYNNNLSYEHEILIRNSLSRIMLLKSKVQKYLINIKPSTIKKFEFKINK